jgi:ketosteroid isomerase-like protein
MRVISFVVCFALIMTLAHCHGMRFDVEEEKANLLETDRHFAKTSGQLGAAGAFDRFLADDAMMMPANARPVYGREAISKLMSEGTYDLTWEPQDGEVSASGDMGWTWGKSVISWVDKAGEKQVRYGKYLNVWKKIDGQWRVQVDIGNQSPAPE